MSLRLRLGHTATGEFWQDVTDWPHLLVAGASGNGKSAFLRQSIVHLCEAHGPDYMQLYLIDLKGVELLPFRGFPWVAGVAVSTHEAVEIVAALRAEVERRKRLLMDAGAVDLAEYNAESPRLPYLVLMVDEYAQFHASASKGDRAAMESLWQLGRFVGLHCFVATQRPTADVISGQIKANCEAKLAFAVRNWRESQNILDMSGAENLPCPGRALFSFGRHTHLLQVPYLPLGRARNILREEAIRHGRPVIGSPKNSAGPEPARHVQGRDGSSLIPDDLSGVQVPGTDG